MNGGREMLECIITETHTLDPVLYEWGGVKWVANNDLNPGCEQSFGLVHILPGRVNPEHWHTRAEETVFMLQGVKHEVGNEGWEPVIYVCSFNASMRGTLFENPTGSGVRPLSAK